MFNLFQFKIALCQLLVTADKEMNIARAQKAIEEAAEKGAQLVLLPVSWRTWSELSGSFLLFLGRGREVSVSFFIFI